MYRLITTLMDAGETPAQEVAALYHERWEVETTLREVKAELRGGSLKTFRSRTPALVRQELYGFLLAHYLVRRALWDSATQAQVDPDVLSFKHAVHVLTRRIPQLVGRSPGAAGRTVSGLPGGNPGGARVLQPGSQRAPWRAAVREISDPGPWPDQSATAELYRHHTLCCGLTDRTGEETGHASSPRASAAGADTPERHESSFLRADSRPAR